MIDYYNVSKYSDSGVINSVISMQIAVALSDRRILDYQNMLPLIY